MVATTIPTKASNIGLNLSGYDTSNVKLSLVGGASMTELTLSVASGQDPATAFQNLLQQYGSACVPVITASCPFQEAGYDPLHGVFTFSYRQVTADGTNSIEISYARAIRVRGCKLISTRTTPTEPFRACP